ASQRSRVGPPAQQLDPARLHAPVSPLRLPAQGRDAAAPTVRSGDSTARRDGDRRSSAPRPSAQDLVPALPPWQAPPLLQATGHGTQPSLHRATPPNPRRPRRRENPAIPVCSFRPPTGNVAKGELDAGPQRSEEHTSELQ